MDNSKEALSSTPTASHPAPHVEEVTVTESTTTTTVASPSVVATNTDTTVASPPVVATNTVTTVASSPVVATNTVTTNVVSQEAYVTKTSGQTADGPQPVTADQVAPAAAAGASAPKNGGPFSAIRNFFRNLFGPGSRQAQGERQKASTTGTASTTTPPSTQKTKTIKTTTVATSNPPT